MHRFYGMLIAALVLATAAHPQIARVASSVPSAPSTAQPVNLHTVDLVAQDKDGHPLHGLRVPDFRLTDDNTPQTLLQVAEHTPLTPLPQPQALPPLPPGTFTDYTPIAPGATLNILLLDALNTPVNDPNFIRNQLQRYVSHASPSTPIAIFGLANRLILLQGFTSNPDTLKNILDHKLIPRSDSLLNHRSSAAISQPSSSAADFNALGMAQVAANLQQFEAQIGSMETQLRMPFTLDALNTLAHYLSAFPGRKNLIWFSGTFPINLNPAPSPKGATAPSPLDPGELRQTISLLSTDQVAVYPIDARGIISQPGQEFTPATASSTHGKPAKPVKLSENLKKLDTSAAAERSAIDTLAAATGGKPFHNATNLADAVASAITAGANDYTLTYSPTNPKDNAAYHQIRVSLPPNQASSGAHLSYRPGYYAQGAAPPLPTAKAAPTPATTTTPAPSTSDKDQQSAYEAAAMSRGAPEPENLLFKARALPASNNTESSVAPNNTLDPSVSPKGPFRRYDVDFVALPNKLSLTLQPDGTRIGQVEFLAYVFDVYGRILNATGKLFQIKLTPANYDRFVHGAVGCHLEISVPNSKETFLRLGMRDIPSDKLGVVEIPTADISHLPPATDPAASSPTPATAPSTPPPASAVPSTRPAPPAAPSSPPQG